MSQCTRCYMPMESAAMLCDRCQREQHEAYVRAGLVERQPTAYERAQAELRERIDRIDVNHAVAFRNVAKELYDRLDAALRRIEQLELEVARLQQSALNPMMVLQKCTHKPDCHHCHVEARERMARYEANKVEFPSQPTLRGQVHADYALTNLEDQAAIAKQLGGRGLGPLPDVRGCPHVWCKRVGCDGNHPIQGPAQALPDEGT